MEAQKYLEGTVSSLRSAIAKQEAPPKKKKGKAADAPKPPKVVGVRLEVAPAFSGWRAVVLEALAGLFDAASKTFPDTVFKDVLAALAASPEAGDMPAKKLKQLAMPFTKFKSDQARVGGAIALGLKLPFDEAGVIEGNGKPQTLAGYDKQHSPHFTPAAGGGPRGSRPSCSWRRTAPPPG